MTGKSFKIVDGDISDGFHTFNELYDHRCLLFLNICIRDVKNCYWIPDIENWFCLYWESSSGQISYHIPNKFLNLVQSKIVRNETYSWDGHNPEVALFRLKNELEKFLNEKNK